MVTSGSPPNTTQWILIKVWFLIFEAKEGDGLWLRPVGVEGITVMQT